MVKSKSCFLVTTVDILCWHLHRVIFRRSRKRRTSFALTYDPVEISGLIVVPIAKIFPFEIAITRKLMKKLRGCVPLFFLSLSQPPSFPMNLSFPLPQGNERHFISLAILLVLPFYQSCILSVLPFYQSCHFISLVILSVLSLIESCH